MTANTDAEFADAPIAGLQSWRNSRLSLRLSWFVIGLVFLLLRWPVDPALQNVDEAIPYLVSRAMESAGTLDPNWNIGGEMPAWFDIPSYGFSSYILLVHPLIVIMPDTFDLVALRWANMLMQATAIVLASMAVLRMGWGAPAALTGALLLSIAPGMVHDSHMARPESLLYLLFAAILYLITAPRIRLRTAALIGVMVGLGMATKVTFAAVLVIAAWPIVREAMTNAGRAALLALAGLGGLVIGFAIGAPYALINPDVYLSGVDSLMTQYAGGHPPHSRPDYSIFNQAGWMAAFFAMVYGPVVFLAPLGAALWTRHVIAVGLAGFCVLMFLYFSTQKVFFERNLCLVIFAAIILASGLVVRAGRWGMALAIVSVAPMMWWSMQIALQSNFDWDKRLAWQAERMPQPLTILPEFSGRPTDCEGAIGLIDYKHPFNAQAAQRLEATGFRPLGRFKGLFHILPLSTMDTYLSADHVYFACGSEPEPGSYLAAQSRDEALAALAEWGPGLIFFGPSSPAADFFGENWTEPDVWGAWTLGERTTLTLPAKIAKNPVRSLDFEFYVFAPDPAGQEITILVDGLPIGRRHVPQALQVTLVWVRAELPRSFNRQGGGATLDIEINVSPAISPAEAGVGPDVRRLGVGLVSVAFNQPG